MSLETSVLPVNEHKCYHLPQMKALCFGHSLEDLVRISHVHLQVIGSKESQLYPRVFYKAGCCPEVEDQRVWRGEVGQIYIEQIFFFLRGKLFGLTSYQRLMRTFVLRKLWFHMFLTYVVWMLCFHVYTTVLLWHHRLAEMFTYSEW